MATADSTIGFSAHRGPPPSASRFAWCRGQPRGKSCQFRGVTSSVSREYRLRATLGVNSWLERGIMRTGSRLAFLLVRSRLSVEGPGYDPPGFNGGQPAPTARCPRCRGQSQLKSKKHYRYMCSGCGNFWYCSSCNYYLSRREAKSHLHIVSLAWQCQGLRSPISALGPPRPSDAILA